jgi:aminopeptidase
MRDPRIQKMAQVLVNYSVKVQPKDKVLIHASVEAAPLVEALYEEIIKKGAYPVLRLGLPGLSEIYYKYANDWHHSYLSEYDVNEMKTCDCVINIMAANNTKALQNVPSELQAKERKAKKILSELFMERTSNGSMRGVITLFPTPAFAQEAMMGTYEYEEFVMNSCFLNDPDPIARWQEMSRIQQKLVDYLNTKNIIRIKAPGTDIEFKVTGRTWINCDGRLNFPDGEVFTGPHEDYTHGHISFSYPAHYTGKDVEGVKLYFEKGKIVDFEATENYEFLKKMIEIDEGARVVGELAIGTNWGVQRYSRNVLFDEKIGGTIHVAIGQSIPQSGGKNKSAIHWDMINSMRDGGEIWADGELIQKNGEFCLDL